MERAASTGGGPRPPQGAIPADGEGAEDQAAAGSQGPCLAGGLDSDVGLGLGLGFKNVHCAVSSLLQLVSLYRAVCTSSASGWAWHHSPLNGRIV